MRLIKMIVLSECYLRSRGRLTILREKNVSLIMDIKNAATRKASSAMVLKSAQTE